MGSSKKMTVGYRYRMGLHMGLCHEPDAMLAITAGDRRAWTGEVTESTTIGINAPNLFGGDEREGGIQGTCDVMMGREDQVPNGYLAMHQGTPQPAYRGFLGLVYRGLIASNNPYIKNWAVRVRSILRGWHGGEAWNPGTATVPTPTGVQTVFTESFDSGLAPYRPWSGNMAGASIVADGGKAVMRIAPVGYAGAERDLAVSGVVSITGRFRVVTPGAGDDWGVLDFNGPDAWIGVAVARNGQQNNIAMGFPGFGGDYNTGQPIPTGVWHGFEINYNQGTRAAFVRVTREDTGAVVLHQSGVATQPIPSTATMILRTDSSGSGTVDWSDISVAGSVPGRAMNPAHIIFQALTDPDWGMGYPAATIDQASFIEAAAQLFNEGLGLCLKWNSQTTIQEFTQVVADHASLVYGQDRRTGKFRMRLLRNDYNEGDLPVFTRHDVKVIRYQRPSLSDTVNEVVVEFVDAVTGKDSTTAPLQNLGNIQGQGRVVSQTLSFPGIPTHDLATRVGMRELQARSTPLWRFSIEAKRRFASLLPGEPFVLDLRDTEIGVRLVMRAGDIDYGEPADGTVRAECVEDVFGMPMTTYVGNPGPGGEVPDTSPKVGPAAAFEVPYTELVQVMGAAELDALQDDAGFVGAVALRPAGVPLNYGLFTRLGGGEFDDAAAGDYAPGGVLEELVPAEPGPTVLKLASASGLGQLLVGSAAMIGEGANAETVRVDSVSIGDMEVTVGRGCGDTVPSEWPPGTRLWGFDVEAAADPQPYVDGETIDVKVVNRTASGQVELSAVPTHSITIASRQARPYPPGWPLVNGEVDPPESVIGDVTLTWAHRDRVLQADTQVDTSEPSVGPEPGTTYTVRWILNGVLAHTSAGIIGNTVTWSPNGGGLLRIELESERDGLASWQMHVREVMLGAPLLTEDDQLITTEDDQPILLE